MSFRWLFGALSPAGSSGRLSVMIFHRVLPVGDPLFPGEVDARRFEALIARLKDWFNVIPLAEALAALEVNRLPSRPLAITFDDGYADNCTVALPILQRHRVSATFFIAAGFIDGGRMWNDTVIEAIRRWSTPEMDLGELGLGTHRVGTVADRRAAIDHILPRLKYLPSTERDAATAEIGRRCGAVLPDDLMLSSAQLQVMGAAGMTFGAHTLTHPILATLPDAAARREIVEGRNRLEALVGDRIRYFAYPNGRPGKDYLGTHVAMVRELGFDAAFSTAWGVSTKRSDRFQLPRFTPWDDGGIRYGVRMAQNLRRSSFATT